jgi:hypothetical protein
VSQRGPRLGDLAALGITNQRETTVLWNSKTGIRPDTGRYLYGGGAGRGGLSNEAERGPALLGGADPWSACRQFRG